MAFVTTTSPDLYATTSNLEEIPAGADPLQYADDDKMNQILVGLTALHGWASGVPVSETANGHFLAMAAGSSAAVSVAAGVRIRQSSGALDYSYNTGAYARLLSKLTLASQATGDIMYASAADTWTRLAAGTNGYVLTLAGGVPTWAAAGGGGGIADSDNVVWTGEHSFEGVAFNVNPLATFAAGVNVTGTLAVTGGATISTTLGLAAGAAATPSLYATGDTNTGLYFPAADQVALTTGGTARILIDSSTLLMGLILTGPAGSASLPTYGFTGDPNTGAYNLGADQYGISTGGTLRLTVSTTGVTSTLPVLGPSGSAAAPGLSFSTEPDCGLFIGGANSMGLATAGSQRILIDTALITMQLPVAAAAGSVSAPGYGFDSDGDLGLYRVAANTLGISTGNFLKMELGDATKNIALRATTATTNATTRLETYEALCSSTAAVGFGAQLCVNAQNASGSQIAQGTLDWAWTNATAASEAADLLFRMRTPGTMADAAKLTSVGAWQVGAGSASLPSLTFLGDTNTGFYNSAADEISTTIGGTARIRTDASRTVWTYGSATPDAAAHIGEWYTSNAEGRIKVKSENTSGYGGFIAKGSDANKILSMAVYGASTAGTTMGVTNASLAEVVAVSANMVIYTTGAQSLSLGTNSSASPVIQLGSTAATLGFYGVTPTARAAAYTQTYSTAARTVTSGMSVDQLAQIVNSLIDDLQAYGLAQ